MEDSGSSDTRAIQAEYRDTALMAELERDLSPTFAQVESEWEQAEDAAPALVEATLELGLIRGAAEAMREADQTYRAKLAEIRASNKSREWKQEQLEQAEAQRAAAAEPYITNAATQAAKLQGKFAAPSLPAPSRELAAEAALAIQRFPFEDAGSFLRTASEVFKTATDPSAPPAERYRANSLLSHVYLPLVTRRARAPEAFARTLVPAAEKLSQAIEKHLDTVTGKRSANAAKEMAERVATEFQSVQAWRQKGDPWDLIQMAHPLLFPKRS